MLARLVRLFIPRLKQAVCIHKFDLDDLKLTGIEEPIKPYTNEYDAWVQYLSGLNKHDSYLRRVVWPCYKCGKEFYAHCGLDIPKPKAIASLNKPI